MSNEGNINPAREVLLSAMNLYLEKWVRRSRLALQPQPQHLYHYTTVEGLEGIIESGCIHASAAYYLNDSSEIDYGCSLFASVLSEWFGHNKSDLSNKTIDPFIGDILWFAKNAFFAPESLRNLLFHVYVACFCEEENLLSQWRAYGQSGGYSIGFDCSALDTGFDSPGDLQRIRLLRVIYDQEDQSNLLANFLEDIVATLRDSDITRFARALNGSEVRTFIGGFRSYLISMALSEIARFKHPAFKEEREWRIVVIPWGVAEGKLEIGALQFRPSRGMLIPYHKLRHNDEREKLPIVTVRYGPTLEKRRTENALSLFLKQRGYSGVHIHGADIPVRL